jgi:di/tricarboxylate transporter
VSRVTTFRQQLCPPEIKDTPEAPRQAAEKLEQMGPMTRDEKIMLGTMGFALALWVRPRYLATHGAEWNRGAAGWRPAAAHLSHPLHPLQFSHHADLNLRLTMPATNMCTSRSRLLQVCGDMVGISAVVAAMLGLSVLLLTGVLTWRDCLTYPPAWDTLFWFAVLVGAPSATLPVQPRHS